MHDPAGCITSAVCGTVTACKLSSSTVNKLLLFHLN